jgi:hypothetical protein
MAIHNTAEERQLIKLIQKMHIPEEEKNNWVSQIQKEGLNEELVTQIHTKLTSDDNEDNLHKVSHFAEFSRIINRWRLTSNLQKR